MTQKFQVGDRVQFIVDNKVEIDTIMTKRYNTYQLDKEPRDCWIEGWQLAPAPALVAVPQWFDEGYKKLISLSGDCELTKMEMIHYISRTGRGYGFYIDSIDSSRTTNEYADGATKYVNKNKMKLINAVQHGYTVEKEPLYYVKLPYVTWDEYEADLKTNFAYLQHDITSDETRMVATTREFPSSDFKTKLSEETIKSIDERYWAFAVPVEEGEG